MKPPAVCVTEGCNKPAGTPWSPYWCPEHDEERRKKIDESLEAILDKLKKGRDP